MNRSDDDAEGGDPVDRLDIADGEGAEPRRLAGERAEAVGPERHAREQVAEHRADAQAEEQRRDDARRHQEQQRLLVEGKIESLVQGAPPVSRPTTLVDFARRREPRGGRAVACYGVGSSRIRSENARSSRMAHYSRDAESAAIMALAPVIPVLTVESVEDGLGAGEGAGRRRPLPRSRSPCARRARSPPSRRSPSEVPGAVVGAGTITSPGQIDEAVAAGARFLVSPGATPALAEAAAAAPVPFLPGCATASEAMALRELGFRALKLFPAEAVGGAKLLASLAAPLPDLRFCPTGGIDLAKAPDYLKLPQRRLRRRLVDAAEGRAGEGRLRDGGEARPRGGGAEAPRARPSSRPADRNRTGLLSPHA